MSEPSKTAVFVFVITAHLAILAFAFPRLETPGTGQQASASATEPVGEEAKATTPEKPHVHPTPAATAADHQPANAPSGPDSPAADKVQHDGDRSRELKDHDHSQHRLADSEDSDAATPRSDASTESNEDGSEDQDGTPAPTIAVATDTPAPEPEPERAVTVREPSPAAMPRPTPIAVADSSKAPAPTLTQAKSTSATPPRAHAVDSASSDPGHSRMKNLRPLGGKGR